MRMWVLISNLSPNFSHEVLPKFISSDFIVAYGFNDCWKVFQEIGEILLLFEKSIKIIEENVCDFLVVESDAILFVDIVENC